IMPPVIGVTGTLSLLTALIAAFGVGWGFTRGQSWLYRSPLAANRAQFYLDVASGPFYGFNRDGAEISQGTIQNWWRQGMIG
ncbi:hypothetical protein PXW85_27105, partial [Klebsiella pneumoniae]|nr:hypothetical protein [Klebsiella pneumoniae]